MDPISHFAVTNGINMLLKNYFQRMNNFICLRFLNSIFSSLQLDQGRGLEVDEMHGLDLRFPLRKPSGTEQGEDILYGYRSFPKTCSAFNKMYMSPYIY